MNINDNIRNIRKLVEKLRWYTYKITYISTTNQFSLVSFMPVLTEHETSTDHQNINTLNIYLGIFTFISRKISCSFELSMTNVL